MLKELAFVYSRWDGSQEVDLRWERLADELLDRFLRSGDLAFALEWLMRQGFDFGADASAMKGLNRMVEELMKLRRELLERFNLSNIGAELRRELDKILDIEKKALSRRFDEARSDYQRSPSETARRRMEELFSREGRLAGLPKKLREALEALKNYEWLSDEADRRFHELVDAIQRLQDFASRNWFSGSRPMSLEETMAMIDRINRINRLIDALDQGLLNQVNLEDLAEFLGPEARQSIETMLRFLDYIKNSGLIQQGAEGWELSPKAIRRMGQKALREICSTVSKDTFGGHESKISGNTSNEYPRSSKRYEHGDPMQIDLKETLMSAVLREIGGSPPFPIRLAPRDFHVFETEHQSSTSVALCLDMSLSMVREGRFGAAKKVAMAMEHLVRTQFPRDRFYVVGFSTVARELRGRELAYAAGSVGGDIFTNIQDALRLSSRLLARSGSKNKHIILITDGQPTAYTLEGKLHVEWPVFGVSPNANRETLKEVRRVTSEGITVNTFMLDAAPELVNFVNQLTKINRGRAFYTTPEKLGEYLLVDYMNRKRRIVH